MTKQNDEIANTLTTLIDYVRWGMSRMHEADVCLAHGYGNSWNDCLALIMDALHLPSKFQPSLLNTTLLPHERHTIIDLINRRVDERIPTAYLTNKMRFCGLEFFVDERVLIPRSPIGELITAKFPDLIDISTVKNALDVCTGSGCIAIAMARNIPGASVDAIDISPEALEVAKINVQNLDINNQVNLIQGNLLEPVLDKQYDLIVTNPPYVDAQEMDSRPTEYRHEPELGLAAGNDGLDLVRIMFPQVAKCLSPNGIFICEVGNSCVALAEAFPDVPFSWLTFKRGGMGIFGLTAKTMKKHFG